MTIGTILLVEDDPDIAILAQISLEELGGWRVIHFETGPEALASVGDLAPDLVILDFRLPGMNGEELYERLRDIAATCSVPIIFMTASVMPNQVERLKALGAAEVLPKPFDPVELSARIAAIWERSRSSAEETGPSRRPA